MYSTDSELTLTHAWHCTQSHVTDSAAVPVRIQDRLGDKQGGDYVLNLFFVLSLCLGLHVFVFSIPTPLFSSMLRKAAVCPHYNN